MVYLLKCGDFYKIGFTSGRKADDRIRDMQVGNPYKLELAGLWHGTMYHESALHVVFAERRTRGEWFALTDEDVSKIGPLLQSWTEDDAKAKAAKIPEPLSVDPRSLPAATFPPGLNVPVADFVGCTWCGTQLRFVGEINYLVCELCDRKVPMGQVICNRDRRNAVIAVMKANACS